MAKISDKVINDYYINKTNSFYNEYKEIKVNKSITDNNLLYYVNKNNSGLKVKSTYLLK